MSDNPTYPLAKSVPDKIVSATGFALSDVTLENVLSALIDTCDLTISRTTLMMQADIAEEAEYSQLAENLARAAELVAVPIDEVLRIYHALRPRRSTLEELRALADQLEQQFCARRTATLIREAADAYARENLLRSDELQG
jgi:propanediol dehydratase small subunit